MSCSRGRRVWPLRFAFRDVLAALERPLASALIVAPAYPRCPTEVSEICTAEISSLWIDGARSCLSMPSPCLQSPQCFLVGDASLGRRQRQRIEFTSVKSLLQPGHKTDSTKMAPSMMVPGSKRSNPESSRFCESARTVTHALSQAQRPWFPTNWLSIIKDLQPTIEWCAKNLLRGLQWRVL